MKTNQRVKYRSNDGTEKEVYSPDNLQPRNIYYFTESFYIKANIVGLGQTFLYVSRQRFSQIKTSYRRESNTATVKGLFFRDLSIGSNNVNTFVASGLTAGAEQIVAIEITSTELTIYHIINETEITSTSVSSSDVTVLNGSYMVMIPNEV